MEGILGVPEKKNIKSNSHRRFKASIGAEWSFVYIVNILHCACIEKNRVCSTTDVDNTGPLKGRLAVVYLSVYESSIRLIAEDTIPFSMLQTPPSGAL